MSRLRVAPIVEGHGEVQAVRTLLERIWIEIVGGEYLDILQPIRQKRTQIEDREELLRAVNLAALKLRARSQRQELAALVLLLIDHDPSPKPPCELGPELLGHIRDARPDLDSACVLAHPEYETWFVAAAESLSPHLDLSASEIPAAPEESGSKKKWIEDRFRGTRYSETIDQPAMTRTMDLKLCRRRSPSFDKLCRELARRHAHS